MLRKNAEKNLDISVFCPNFVDERSVLFLRWFSYQESRFFFMSFVYQADRGVSVLFLCVVCLKFG